MLPLSIRQKHEGRSLKLVESLIDVNISPEHLKTTARLLSQANYRDVAEERAIDKNCGYPLCANQLTKGSSQKYHISTRLNKVFDITERKIFCSDFCYRASKYVENQLPTVPYWMSDSDPPLDIALLDPEENGFKGEEIPLRPTLELNPLDEIPLKSQKGGSVSGNVDFTKATADLAELTICDGVIESDKHAIGCTANPTKFGDVENLKTESVLKAEKMGTTVNASGDELRENLNSVNSGVEAELTPSGCDLLKSRSHSMTAVCDRSLSTSIGSGAMKPSATTNPMQYSRKKKNEPKRHTPAQNVESVVLEWITPATVTFLSTGQVSRKAAGSNQAEDSDQWRQEYRTVCTKIAALEAKDKQMDSRLIGESVNSDLKTLPSYDDLKQKAAEFEIKAQAFYSGRTQAAPPAVDRHDDDEVKIWNSAYQTPDTTRKKIVMEKIRNTMPKLMALFNLQSNSCTRELKALIDTFKFSAENITLKPVEWNLVAIILLQMLSNVSDDLRAVLQQPIAKQVVGEFCEGQSTDFSDIEKLNSGICLHY